MFDPSVVLGWEIAEFISYINFSISTMIWWHAFLSVLALICISLSSAKFIPNLTVVNTVFGITSFVASDYSYRRSVTKSNDIPIMSCISKGVIKSWSGISSSSKRVILCFLAVWFSLFFILRAMSEFWSYVLSVNSLIWRIKLFRRIC